MSEPNLELRKISENARKETERILADEKLCKDANLATHVLGGGKRPKFEEREIIVAPLPVKPARRKMREIEEIDFGDSDSRNLPISDSDFGGNKNRFDE